MNSLYKAELVSLDGFWRDSEYLDAVTADWVHWFNAERLDAMLEYTTPTKVQTGYRPAIEVLTAASKGKYAQSPQIPGLDKLDTVHIG